MAESDGFQAALVRIAAVLCEWNHPAALIGGAAVIARVRPRFTDDIDLVIRVTEKESAGFEQLLKRHGFFFDDTDLEMIREGGLLRAWMTADKATSVGIDFLYCQTQLDRDLTARAQQLPLFGVTVPVATAEDLVLLKLDANRPIDIDDVLAIKDALNAQLDHAYLKAQAARFNLLDRYQLYFAG